MTRRSEKVSLNTLAYDSTYKLIDDTLALGVNLTEVHLHLYTSWATHLILGQMQF